jgi:hypothetical protein
MRGKIGPRVIRATVFRQASIERLLDAKCLHKAGRFQGAIYLCGYALECRLKFCVCVSRRVANLAESEARTIGHKLDESLAAAGLNVKLFRNEDLRVAFLRIVRRWSTEIRYSGSARSYRESESFLNDTTVLLRWLETESKS